MGGAVKAGLAVCLAWTLIAGRVTMADPEPPSGVLSRVERASAWSALGDKARAVDMIESELREHPGDPTLLELAGRLRLGLLEPELAESHFRLLLSSQPTVFRYRVLLGRSLLMQGKTQAALENVVQAARFSPTNASVGNARSALLAEIAAGETIRNRHWQLGLAAVVLAVQALCVVLWLGRRLEQAS